MPLQQPANDLCHRMKLLSFHNCHLPNGINRLFLLVTGFSASTNLWGLNTPAGNTTPHTERIIKYCLDNMSIIHWSVSIVVHVSRECH